MTNKNIITVKFFINILTNQVNIARTLKFLCNIKGKTQKLNKKQNI